MGQDRHREVPGHRAPRPAAGPGDGCRKRVGDGRHQAGVGRGLVSGEHTRMPAGVGQGSGTGAGRSMQRVPLWGKTGPRDRGAGLH